MEKTLQNKFHWYFSWRELWFQVTYQTEHFLDKNKDYVVAEHQSLLSASRCSFVADLFPPLPEESSKTSKFSSIGSRFKVCLCSNAYIDAVVSFFCAFWFWFLLYAYLATIAIFAWNTECHWAALRSLCEAK